MYAAARRRIHHAPEIYFHVKKAGRHVRRGVDKKAGRCTAEIRKPGSLILRWSRRCRCNGKGDNEMNLGFLASHRGSNMQAAIEACQQGQLHATPCVVISNNSRAEALVKARHAGIPAYHLSAQTHPLSEELDAVILNVLRRHQVDLILLAGYLKKLGPKTLQHYKNHVLNIHPALLPKFGGQGMYGTAVHEEILAQ